MKKRFSFLLVMSFIMLCAVAVDGRAGFEYCGDANDSNFIDIDDAVYLVDYILQNGPPPTPFPVASGDANGSCDIDIDDPVYVVFYIFCGGPPTFWQGDFAVQCGDCLPGDVDDDGLVGPDDLAYIEFCTTHPELCPDFPPCCADVDGDGAFTVDDVIYLTNFVYSGGPAPEPSTLCLY